MHPSRETRFHFMISILLCAVQVKIILELLLEIYQAKIIKIVHIFSFQILLQHFLFSGLCIKVENINECVNNIFLIQCFISIYLSIGTMYRHCFYTCSDTTNCLFSHTRVVHLSTHLRETNKTASLYVVGLPH